MKKSTARIVFILFALLCLPGSAVAQTARGSAVLPHWKSFWTSGAIFVVTDLYITNITSSTISVETRFYGYDGSILSDGSTDAAAGNLRIQRSYSSYNETSANTSSTFDIPAGETAYIQLVNTTTKYDGYGVIQWSQTGDALKGLVAHARVDNYNSSSGMRSRYAVPINGGAPF